MISLGSRLVFANGEVAIAIAASASVKAVRMRHLITDFDAGPRSAYGKRDSTTASLHWPTTPHPLNAEITVLFC